MSGKDSPKLLYNENGLTDNYYQQSNLHGEYKLFCFGKAYKNGYLMTCPFKGTVMLSAIKQNSIGISLTDKTTEGVGVINALLW